MERVNPTRQIITASIAAIPTFTYGIQIGWLSPMGPLLKSSSTPASVPLSDAVVSWLAAALPLAAICGIPFFSYASDKFGRKACGIAVSLLSCISWCLKLWCITPTGLIAGRIIGGVAAGGCFVVVPLYIKEVAEDRCRGALGAMNMTLCKLGVIFVYWVGMSASYHLNQALYLALAATHCCLFSFMPESPNYLLKVGREKRAIKAISWLRGIDEDHELVSNEITKLKEEQKLILEAPQITLRSVGKRAIKAISWLRGIDEDHELVSNEITKLKEEQKLILEAPQITLRSVVKDRANFSALRMVIVLMGMQTLSGCFALMNYAADVFSRVGTAWSPNTLALMMGSLQLAGSAFTTVSIERFGRKIPLASSSLVVSVCMAALATCFLVGSESVPWLPVVAVCVCILAYGAGLAPVPMVYMAEVFTFQMRARMAGLSMMFSFFCSSMTVLFYTPVANQFGPYVVFYTFSAISMLGVVYTVLWVPETKGKSLGEIQKYWKKDEPVFV